MDSSKIILLGYMGSGKSIVGNQLAKTLSIKFIDLDRFIERAEGHNITEIFESKGELYFRAQERKYLEVLLKDSLPMVLSLGGGTPCYYDTMEYIQSLENLTSFYLNTDINTLVLRLLKEKATRPLIAHLENEDAVKEFIGKHLFERNRFYQQAHHQISTDQKSVETLVKDIKKKLS